MNKPINSVDFNRVLQQLRTQLTRLEDDHQQEVKAISEGRPRTSFQFSSIITAPKSPFDTIKTFVASHDRFMQSIDARFMGTSLTYEQAETVNQFKREAMSEFHQCLTQTQAALSESENYTLVGYINAQKMTHPEDLIHPTPAYDKGVSLGLG